MFPAIVLLRFMCYSNDCFPSVCLSVYDFSGTGMKGITCLETDVSVAPDL